MEMQTAAQSGVQRLYHYQDANLDYLRDTLTNRRVHLSNPKNFNDLWDCKPYFQFDVEYQESRRKWGLHLDSHHRDFLPAVVRAQLETGGNWYDKKEFLAHVITVLKTTIQQNIGRWRM